METITYAMWERLFQTSIDLVKSTSNIHDLMNSGVTVPDEIYTNVIRLHNSAIDFIIAMKEFNKEV